MILVGLTGNIGSSKSSVAETFAARGATIIDADVLARRVVEQGTPGFDRVRERWGTMILDESGDIDRAALRGIVFDEPDELEQLNAIVHPEVERLRQQDIADAEARGDRVVVCDIPLLFERHLADRFDTIILVDAPRPMRLERLVRDRGLTETDAMAMIAAQMPAELKRARADIIIDNDGSLDDLAMRAAEAWATLDQMADERVSVP
ncbi:MAG: dephospho-CoA kinase [Gemmatimonadaceae bacterium]|nr:dephospho-CoA kinase [Gemmatimonadaceae bacterium]